MNILDLIIFYFTTTIYIYYQENFVFLSAPSAPSSVNKFFKIVFFKLLPYTCQLKVVRTFFDCNITTAREHSGSVCEMTGSSCYLWQISCQNAR